MCYFSKDVEETLYFAFFLPESGRRVLVSFPDVYERFGE